MIVCLCNGLTEEEVAAALRAGSRSPREVFGTCGCLRQCGKCERAMIAILRDHCWDGPRDKTVARD